MKRVSVIMTVTTQGCDESETGQNHGFASYEEGQTYSLGESLAKNFVAMGVCSVVKDDSKQMPQVIENKDLGATPENREMVPPARPMTRAEKSAAKAAEKAAKESK